MITLTTNTVRHSRQAIQFHTPHIVKHAARLQLIKALDKRRKSHKLVSLNVDDGD
jgi:hypothetical protein